MEAGNLLIKGLGKNIDASLLVLSSVTLLPEFKLGKNLVCERRGHDEGRMASSTSQIEKTSFSKNNDTTSRRENELVYLWLDVDTLGGLHKTVHIDFVVEVTNVSNNSVVLHLLHSIGHKDTLVSRGGDENISKSDNVFDGNNLIPFHGGLEGADGINFSNVDHTSIGTHGVGTSLTNITVTADYSLLTGKHHICGAHEAVRKGMLASVKVVELRLGDRVVDVDGGEEEGSSLFHLVETVNTGGRFFGNTLAASSNLVPLVGLAGLKKTTDDGENDLELGVVGRARVGESSITEELILSFLSFVDEEGHVTTVINNKIRSMALAIVRGPGESIEGALPILFEGFSFPGEDSSRLVTGNSSGGMILGGEDVTRTPANISTEFLEGLDQDSGLDSHVERSRNAGSSERLAGSILLTASHESGHLNFSEFDILATVVGKRNVGNCSEVCVRRMQ